MKITAINKNKKKEVVPTLRNTISIQLSERRRIADDLHDHVGPSLSAIKLQLHAIKDLKCKTEMSDMINKVTKDIDILIHDIRKIIQNLTPENMKINGLRKSIEDYRNIVQKNNIQFDFHFEGCEANLREEAQINIYRIVIELINNSLKHSHCSNIKLIFKTYLNKTILVYSDNGCQEKSVSTLINGMGLRSIQSRVKALNGNIFLKNCFYDGAFCNITFNNSSLMKNLNIRHAKN